MHGICEVDMRIQDDGEYICKYVPKEPVLHRLAIISKGIYVAGSPFSICVCTADAHGDRKGAENSPSGDLSLIKDEVTLWGRIARFINIPNTEFQEGHCLFSVKCIHKTPSL